MRICIVDHLGTPYDGDTLERSGLGGSESAVICIARELVKAGFSVDVYNDCSGTAQYDGVTYRKRSDAGVYRTGPYDIFISSRSLVPFTEYTSIRHEAKKKVLWLHDTFVDNDALLEQYVVNGLIDEIWTLSDFHTSYITTCNHGVKRMQEVMKRKVWQTRNGVNLYNDYVDIQKKDKNLFVFNAAVDKGLPVLLNKIWPVFKTSAPAARLKVIGGYYKMHTMVEAQRTHWHQLKEQYDGKYDIEFTGVIPQKDVSKILEEASFMIYPQQFPETFSISLVEALANGVTPITGRFGAAEETAIEGGSWLMDYPATSNVLYQFDEEQHQNVFVKLAVEAYHNDYLWQQKANKGVIVREVCGWDKVALQWKQHIYKILGKYLPVEQYRQVTEINQRCKEIFNTRFGNDEDHVVDCRAERHMRVIVPFRNAELYIEDCIDSIITQDYDNWTLHLVDDGSTDKTIDIVNRKLASLNDYRITFQIAPGVGALANQMHVIDECHTYPGQEVTIVLIDGDDKLVNDPNIFKKISRLYVKGARMTYGSCWSEIDNIPLIAQDYPPDVKANKTYREHKFPWNIPYTHLRTFDARLIYDVDDSALRDSSGEYYRAGGDSALLYALLEACDPDHIVAVKDIWYRYNDAHPNCDYRINSEEQTRNANEILKKNVKNKRILIGIPTAQNIHAATFKSIYNQVIPEGYEVDFQFFYGYCIDQVRNLMAHYTIENGYDYIFFVDYDMEFGPDTLEDLLCHFDNDDVAIASALYRQRRTELVYEAYYNNDYGGVTHYTQLPAYSLGMEVAAVGFGCALVKTEALKSVGYPYFTYHHAIRIEDTISEDVDFCHKVTVKGWKIVLEPNVRCKHHGNITFEV